MVNMTSKIILSKDIRLDRGHQNVLDYTDLQMLSVMNSSAHFVADASDYSFIRSTGTIKADINYDQALRANYFAYQNPSYSNKWFFAFIVRIEYKGENCIEIFYTVDNWQTWFKDLTLLPCFVEREHVNDDTFTKWMEPEPVTSNNIIPYYQSQEYFSTYDIIVVFVPSAGVSSQDLPYNVDNKYISPCRFYRYDGSVSGVSLLLDDLADPTVMGGADIVACFMYPHSLIPTQDQSTKWLGGGLVTITKLMPSVVDVSGYTPKNNKMFLYPYNYIEVDNGSNRAIYRYEYFYTGGLIEGAFRISGAALPDGNITVYPYGYMHKTGMNPFYSLSIADMPQVAIPIDTYAAWLAQRGSIALSQGLLNAFEAGIGGGMTGATSTAKSNPGVGPSAGIGAGMSALHSAIEYQSNTMEARAASDSAKGINSASLDMVNGIQGFNFKRMCVNYEEARRIDHFMSMFGYNVSEVKIPNVTGRRYWNYIKINGVLGHGAIPAGALEDINSIANSGVTVWHDHGNIGNYTIGDADLANPII